MATKKTTSTKKPAAKKAPAKKSQPAKAAKKAPAKKPSKKAGDFTGMTHSEMKANRPAKSTIEGPVAAMWNLCGEMVGKPRKEVITAALNMGITYNTACWQYQAWKTAYNNSK